MIHRFEVQNYKALRDIKLDLTPVHVLIGPNDSGKTSILEAIQALCRSVDFPLVDAFTGPWDGLDLVWRHQDPHVIFNVNLGENADAYRYSLTCRFGAVMREVMRTSEGFNELNSGDPLQPFMTRTPHTNSDVNLLARSAAPSMGHDHIKAVVTAIYDALANAHYYRWSPRLLSAPTAIDSSRRFRMDASGFGLANCLDDILGADRKRFDALEERFQQIFPQVKSIKLTTKRAYRAEVDEFAPIPLLKDAEGKGIEFEFAGGLDAIPASQVSDGMMLVLGYLTLLHLPKPPRVLLFEEPENGIHPKRLHEILRILRELVQEQNHTQVVLTTHSPYALDMFKPEEVTLCRKDQEGAVHVSRLSESESVRRQLDVFSLGEIWTAEGDEALAPTSQTNGKGGVS